MRSHQFTDAVTFSEVKTLRLLHGILENSQPTNKTEFADLMKAAFENKRLDPRVMADDLGYSISSIYRWIEGKSAPHSCMWPKISEWVLDAFSIKIEMLEQTCNGNGDRVAIQ